MKHKPQIEIIIKGKQGVGKTLLAQAIQNFLITDEKFKMKIDEIYIHEQGDIKPKNWVFFKVIIKTKLV